MLSELVTSSVRVSMPFSVRFATDLSERAVAKTRRPWAANASASVLPTPPWEHLSEACQRFKSGECKVEKHRSYLGGSHTYPVMRTVRLLGDDMIAGWN